MLTLRTGASIASPLPHLSKKSGRVTALTKCNAGYFQGKD